MKDNLEIKSRRDHGVSIVDDKHKMAYISYQLKHFKRLDELVRRLEELEPQVVSKEQVKYRGGPHMIAIIFIMGT